MSNSLRVTGPIGEPELRYTKTGNPVLEVSINATVAQKDKTTGRWEDIGDTLWLKCPFWGDRAEQYAEQLQRGDRITVEGSLTMRTYVKRDGTHGTSLELHYPNLLGVMPRVQRGQGTGGSQRQSQASFDTPVDDPWGGSVDDFSAPPF